MWSQRPKYVFLLRRYCRWTQQQVISYSEGSHFVIRLANNCYVHDTYPVAYSTNSHKSGPAGSFSVSGESPVRLHSQIKCPVHRSTVKEIGTTLSLEPISQFFWNVSSELKTTDYQISMSIFNFFEDGKVFITIISCQCQSLAHKLLAQFHQEAKAARVMSAAFVHFPSTKQISPIHLILAAQSLRAKYQ